jgi:outer membrane receptor protein involved in Fe transport
MMAAAFAVELAWATAVRAQAPVGGVRGVVSDAEFGGAVPQAVASLVELNREQATADDGHFLFEGVPPGTYTVTIAKPGYERHVESAVVVAAGALADITIKLNGEFTELEEFMVKDLPIDDTASETGLLNLRSRTLSFQDSISKDLMSRAQAGDAASALKLVVGASVAEGKYATVRGLSDRYVGTALNAMRVPSSDPRRRAVSLDIFPAGTIESMTVAKTFTPDLPGDYTGGGVNIRTISIPDKPFFKFSISREINSTWTGKDGFVTYEGGGCNYWARDTGARDIPPQLANLVSDPSHNGNPLEELGGGYSRYETRVDNNHPQDPRFEAFDRATRALAPTMGVKFGKVPDGNYGYSLSTGSRSDLGEGWSAGWLGAVTYGNKYTAQDAAEVQCTVDTTGVPETNRHYRAQTGSQEVKWATLASLGLAKGDEQAFGFTWLRNQAATDRASFRNQVDLYAGQTQFMRNQGINYTERSLDARQLTWKRKWDGLELELLGAHNLVRQYDPDVRRIQEEGTLSDDGWTFAIRQADAASGTYNPARIWRDVREDNSQYGVNLLFPFRFRESDARLRVGWMEDLTQRTFEQAAYTYSYLQVHPIQPTDPEARAWWDHDRAAGTFVTTNPAAMWTDVFTNPDRIGAGPYQREMRWYIQPTLGRNDITYTGEQMMPSGYWMVEVPLAPGLKAIGGSRAEVTDISVDPVSAKDAMPNYAGQDNYTIVKVMDGGFDLQDVGREQAQAHLTDSRWLRSFGLAYELAPQMNLRINWSQTIARPTFRELAPVLSIDPVENENYFGNKDLTISLIENDDVRWEWFRKPGEVWSVSWFYKHIRDPIEKTSFGWYGETYTVPVNFPEGQVSGMEYEARKKLDFIPLPIGSLNVGINYTEMKSTVVMTEPMAKYLDTYALRPDSRSQDEQFVAPIGVIHTPFLFNFFNLKGFNGLDGPARDMEGQPNFLFNFNLGYDIDEWGTSLNYFYNIRGDVLKTGAAVGWSAVPDVYTKQLDTANISLSQKIGDTLKLTVGAQNLLNATVEDVYRLPDGTEISKRSYREGIRYSVGLSGSW